MPYGRLPLAHLPSPGEDLCESREGDRVGFLPFLFYFHRAAQVTFRTLSFREPLKVVYFFSFATATFAISFLYIIFLSRNLRTISFWAGTAGFLLFLHCILRVQYQSGIRNRESRRNAKFSASEESKEKRVHNSFRNALCVCQSLGKMVVPPVNGAGTTLPRGGPLQIRHEAVPCHQNLNTTSVVRH